jgi:two-component system, NarL family, nitrate/nitrite response regulator NarL
MCGVITVVSTKIALAHRQPMFREGLRSVLASEATFHVVGQATTGHDALSLVRAKQPDLLLLDFEIPDPPALAVLRQLEEEQISVRSILVSRSVPEDQMVQAMELGAVGVIDDAVPANLVLKCIRMVMNGQYWIGRESVSTLIDGLKRARIDRQNQRPKFGLTDRQVEIVAAIVDGLNNPEIAKQLGISQDTVKQHLTAVFDKCGVSTRLELAMFARDHELVSKK